MKITFIVGSMQVKTNGVAAYTSILVKQLETSNHQVSIITLNESKTHNTEAKVLNLDTQLSISKRYSALKAILTQQNPDLISIQFVPYSFHKKGLAYELLIFSLFLKKFKVHFMIHEPWIETTDKALLKNHIVSKLQKALLQKLILFTKPILITSTIPHYVDLIGRNTILLPLYSNILYCPKSPKQIEPNHELKCVFFGTFSFDIEGFKLQLNWIKQYCIKNNLTPKITLLGNNGASKNTNIILIRAMLGENSLLELGWKPNKEISYLLQEQNLGISRATLSLYGKSGSTLAMLEHGLPVLLRGIENLSYKKCSYLNFKNQLIQTTESYHYKITRFEPKVDASNIHSQNFIRLINEALLPS